MTGQHVPMGAGAEFDAIRQLLGVWGPRATGIGDDAAIVSCPDGERIVVSTDSSVEHVHFRREWLTSEQIGGRATAAALSDLAAMAATPRGMLLALVLPEDWRDEVDALARGVGRVASVAGCPIVGGNVSAGAELSLTITVLGTTANPLSRASARAGDAIYVTGMLGGPAAALRAFTTGSNMVAAHLARFASPVPRIAEARWLAARGAHAAIDISDGLFSDAEHVAVASGVTIVIQSDDIPCVEGVTAKSAMRSGEEYELLVAMPSDSSIDPEEFRRQFGIAITRIGTARDRGAEPVVMDGAEGAQLRGHDHLG